MVAKKNQGKINFPGSNREKKNLYRTMRVKSILDQR